MKLVSLNLFRSVDYLYYILKGSLNFLISAIIETGHFIQNVVFEIAYKQIHLCTCTLKCHYFIKRRSDATYMYMYTWICVSCSW